MKKKHISEALRESDEACDAEATDHRSQSEINESYAAEKVAQRVVEAAADEACDAEATKHGAMPTLRLVK